MRPSTSKRFAQAAGKCTDRLRPNCYTLTRRLPPVLVGVRVLSAVALATDGKLMVVSRIFASWNQLDRWLRQLDVLRAA